MKCATFPCCAYPCGGTPGRPRESVRRRSSTTGIARFVCRFPTTRKCGSVSCGRDRWPKRSPIDRDWPTPSPHLKALRRSGLRGSMVGIPDLASSSPPLTLLGVAACLLTSRSAHSEKVIESLLGPWLGARCSEALLHPAACRGTPTAPKREKSNSQRVTRFGSRQKLLRALVPPIPSIRSLYFPQPFPD
jgi:hypothetical protein